MNGVVGFLKPVLTWAYRKPQLFPLAIDVAIWPVALVIGAVLKLVFGLDQIGWGIIPIALLAMGLQAGLGWVTGVYKHRWRVSCFDEVMALSTVWAITSAVIILVNYAARLGQISELPTTAVSIGALVALVMLGTVRAVWRRYWEGSRRPESSGAKQTIVFGAGEGGSQIIRAMMLDPESEYYLSLIHI